VSPVGGKRPSEINVCGSFAQTLCKTKLAEGVKTLMNLFQECTGRTTNNN